MTIDPKIVIASYGFAKDTIKGLFSEKVDERVKEKLQEVLDCIDKMQIAALEKNEQMFHMQSELYELKDKLRMVDEWKDRISEYEMYVAPGKGVVYKSIKAPLHFICPACVEKKQIQILQDHDLMSGEFKCPNCKVDFPVKLANYSQAAQTEYNPY